MKVYEDMERHIECARLCEEAARRMDKEIETDIQPLINTAQSEMKTYAKTAQETSALLDDTVLARMDMDSRVAGAYVLFEKNIRIINIADIEEILQWQHAKKESLDYSVLLSFFVYGVMFDVLNRKHWLMRSKSTSRKVSTYSYHPLHFASFLSP